ncbi:toll-like receptor 13 [Uranotaenia lowii]|uniref:toll-like receptor 13 n=1 Tax=Uranotaenia lowii TaxID=190385 RepID=UPI00247AC7AB|nr:toll-like receptor 13 [Uranotaenia lowii]
MFNQKGHSKVLLLALYLHFTVFFQPSECLLELCAPSMGYPECIHFEMERMNGSFVTPAEDSFYSYSFRMMDKEIDYPIEDAFGMLLANRQTLILSNITAPRIFVPPSLKKFVMILSNIPNIILYNETESASQLEEIEIFDSRVQLDFDVGSLPSLTSLLIQHSSLLELTCDDPIPKKLTNLVLQDSDIHVSINFSTLPNLRKLTLNSVDFTWEDLGFLNNLDIIYLQLARFPFHRKNNGSFSTFSNLHYNGSTLFLPKLKLLSIDSIQLDSERFAYLHFPELISASFHNNSLIQLPEHLKLFKNLTSIVFSRNKFPSCQLSFFASFERLIGLHLSENRIRHFSFAGSFVLPNLNVLDLADNRIEHLEYFDSAQMPKLNTLNLFGNKLFHMEVFFDIRANCPKFNYLQFESAHLPCSMFNAFLSEMRNVSVNVHNNGCVAEVWKCNRASCY